MLRQLICAVAAVSLLAACSSDEGASMSAGAGGTQPGMASGAEAGAGVGAGAGGMAAGQAAPGTQEDLVQSVGDRIFFQTDSSALTDQARATLDRQAAWLQRYPRVNVLVAGNCDERGTEEYNLALGQRRANADRDFLVAHGIAAGRIQTISYGKDRPTDPASTPAAWAKNRNAITYAR